MQSTHLGHQLLSIIYYYLSDYSNVYESIFLKIRILNWLSLFNMLMNNNDTSFTFPIQGMLTPLLLLLLIVVVAPFWDCSDDAWHFLPIFDSKSLSVEDVEDDDDIFRWFCLICFSHQHDLKLIKAIRLLYLSPTNW